MEITVRQAWMRRISIVLVVMTFTLMVLGSWVKATGSGLSCPDWPTCYGEWLPPFPSQETGGQNPTLYDASVDHADGYTQAQVMYEWGHRTLAALVGIPATALLLLGLTGRELSLPLRVTPALMWVLLLVQAGLGAGTVLRGNPAALTTLHLATATLFFFVVTSLLFLTRTPAKRAPRFPGEVV